MREIFTSGSVGRAPGDRCFYPELGQAKALFGLCISLRYILHKPNTTFAFR